MIPLIAWSEYVRRVRSVWFVATTLLAPILSLAVFAVPLLLISLSDEETARTVAIVDETGVLADSVAAALPASYQVAETRAAAGSLRSDVLSGDLGAYLVLPSGVLDGTARPSYYSRGSGIDEIVTLGDAVEDAIRAERVRRAGASAQVVALMDTRVRMNQVTVSDDGDAADGALVQLFVANTLGFLIYLAVFLYGAMVMRGVIEEKANRIVEVVASSVRPFDLLMGKVLGIGAVGLTQLIGWGVLMAASTAAAAPLMLAFAGGASGASAQAGTEALPFDPAALGAAFTPGLLVAFVLFFAGGYLLFASVFAIVGSMVDQEADAQTLQVPVMIPLILPMLFLPYVLSKPDTGLSVGLSLFPFSSPVLMVVRMSVTTVPLWQVALSLAILVVSFIAAVWAASRVYRVGILMYGKKASFRDIWRWLRTA